MSLAEPPSSFVARRPIPARIPGRQKHFHEPAGKPRLGGSPTGCGLARGGRRRRRSMDVSPWSARSVPSPDACHGLPANSRRFGVSFVPCKSQPELSSMERSSWRASPSRRGGRNRRRTRCCISPGPRETTIPRLDASLLQISLLLLVSLWAARPMPTFYARDDPSTQVNNLRGPS